MKPLFQIFLAVLLAARVASDAADFFGIPDKTIVPKPAPATPEPATPAPARGPATPVPITGALLDETPPTLLPDGPYLKTPSIGGGSDAGRAFHDIGPDRGILIGLEYTVGQGGKVIESIAPLYVRPAGKAHGTLRGTLKPGNPATVLEARPGFAVAAIEVRGASALEAFRITFMRYENGVLDPAERYVGKWIGGESTEPAKRLRTDTRPIIGIYGKADGAISEFGLIVRRETGPAKVAIANPFGTPTPPDPGGLPPAPTTDMPDEGPVLATATPPEPTAFDASILKTDRVGGDLGWGAPFRDLAPLGSILIGFDYATIKKDSLKIASLRPLYLLANGSRKLGDLHGEPPTTARSDARPGYAVGAITTKGGSIIDGFQLTFMKLKGSALDPADSYQGDWIGGGKGTDGAKRLDGGAQPFVGLYGKSGKEVNELGFFVKNGGGSAASVRPLIPGPAPSTPAPATPASGGGIEVFACADSEYTLFLNGRQILAGSSPSKVDSGSFSIVKGDVLTAVVKDSGGDGGWLSLRVVRDGKTALDAGDMRYLTSETLNWKTNKLTTGFREPKVWTHGKQMGTDARPRAAWANAKDNTAAVLYFKALMP